MKFNELPIGEQNILSQVYGSQTAKSYNQKIIVDVEEIPENQKYFFDKTNLISSSFFVQKLYKISGHIVPLKFNLAVSKLIENTDDLRANYCQVNERTLKVVFQYRREIPNIVYRNLQSVPDIDAALKNIMEADMRQNFDIRYDFLFRFSVFHTGEAEYAILITAPQIIANCFDVKKFFQSVMDSGITPAVEKINIPIVQQNSEPIKNYWTGILKDLPNVPQLPFTKLQRGLPKQKAYRFTIPRPVMSGLREKAASNKIMLMTIFQTAWAILLQEFNHSLDVAFSTLAPDKVSGDTNLIPVRISAEENTTLQNLVNNQFKQILISQPYACNNYSVIQQIIKPQNKHFDHFLSFSDFLKDEKLYSETVADSFGVLVLQNSWSTNNTKLGIYFHYNEDSPSITILYDERGFTENFGKLISERFLIVLQQMISCWNFTHKQFMENLSTRLQAEPATEEDNSAYLLNFISRLKIFQAFSKGITPKIMAVAKLTTFFEGDRIDEKYWNENILIVAEGKLVRSIDVGDGWYNTLDIVKENRWINELILLENPKSRMTAEVLTEKAILMSIPKEFMKSTLNEEPTLKFNFLLHVLEEMEKYQRLWVQS